MICLFRRLLTRGIGTSRASSRSDYDTTFFKAVADSDLDKQFQSYKDSFVLRSVLDTWGSRTTGEILDHVYFRTEPMQRAIRNEKLDFSKVLSEQPLTYKRSASGRNPGEIHKMREEFKRRAEVQKAQSGIRFDFTPPNYDQAYEEALRKLHELARRRW
jgi:hypothetical protein